MKPSALDNPDTFLQLVPRNVEENIAYRMELHKWLMKDKGAQRAFARLCFDYPELFYDLCVWTFNPQMKTGKRNVPFILRPAQREVVRDLKIAIDEGESRVVEKSRKEGATVLISTLFVLYFLFSPQSTFLMGSRKEELVDQSTTLDMVNSRVTGDHVCLFHKVLYALVTLPMWMKPNVLKTHLHLENLENMAAIDGEATNENFGAGDRRTAVMLDEFGRVDYKMAASIRDSIYDVTDCVLYNSTHWFGSGHPFSAIARSGTVKVLRLPWFVNPEKSGGLYKSPDLNKIIILDDYYNGLYGNVFNYPVGTELTYSDLLREIVVAYPEAELNLVADGANKFRSLWYDREEKKRSRRDMAANIDMNPGGAGDMFFDTEVCNLILQQFTRKPNFKGNVKYDVSKNWIVNGRFVQDGTGFFKWWGQLDKGRPLQYHNYVVGCDISMGAGASNSVAKVYDVNTNEMLGSYVNSRVSPDDFANTVLGLCQWVGGASRRPFLIWEANGPGGVFGKRVIGQHYYPIYRTRNERARDRSLKGHSVGWYSSRPLKYDLLCSLRCALAEGVKASPVDRFLKIYDEDTILEYENYVFLENGDIGSSYTLEEEGGARGIHGDRVIPDGLYILALQDQRAAPSYIEQIQAGNSMAVRLKEAKEEERQKKENSPWLI